MNLDEAKTTIRQLLNLAENSAAAEMEAENALRFARRLMLRHNLQETDIPATTDGHERAADREVQYNRVAQQTLNANVHQWESYLMHAVCRLVGTVQHYRNRERVARRTPHGTRAFNAHGVPAWSGEFVVYGPAEDVQAAVELYQEWSTILVSMARLRFAYVFKAEGRAYCEAFACAVYNKVLTILREEEVQVTTGKDLVLIRARDTIEYRKAGAIDWLRSQGVVLGTPRSAPRRVVHYHEAETLGRTDGARLDIARKPRVHKLSRGAQ